MKIQSIKQQNNSFRGVDINKVTGFISKHPGVVAGLASSSVVAQKLVMSASELAFAPFVDLGTGEAITKITKEEDGRTNQSSRVQAIRTVAQTVGGTITGVVIRAVCIGLMTSALVKAGGKTGSVLSQMVNKNSTKNTYEIQKNAEAIGRNIGGLMATFVMMVTNFLLDVPIINYINKTITDIADNIKNGKKQEVKNGK